MNPKSVGLYMFK